jgi:outer membrane protein OmpA-like peptidoglycan-associated protein
MPVSKPQRDWFGLGGSLALGLSRSFTSWFALSGRIRSAGFASGDKPTTPGVKRPGFGSLNAATLGVAFRLPDGSARRATGLWIEANAGGGLTGSDLKPVFDVGLGYGFAVGKSYALAPVLRYLQVMQTNDQLAPSDARLAFAGVRFSLLDSPPRSAKPKSKPQPELPDRDNDGVLDLNDQCIDVPEDRDDFQDSDGCPEADNDGDGIFDREDGCPNIAEDKDGFQDDDGCLDDDNDQDGVLDVNDKCPLEPETLNGEQDDDGCPDKGLIVMEDDRIVLEERVLFDVQRARVKSSAIPVLEAIVRLCRQHPEWRKVRVEGHADARGDAAQNQELSEHRAANVRAALIKLGMETELVTAEGYGSTRLLTRGTEEEDHRRNRRVEFAVIARYEDGVPPAAASEVPAAKPSEEPAPLNPFEDPEAGAVEHTTEEAQP